MPVARTRMSASYPQLRFRRILVYKLLRTALPMESNGLHPSPLANFNRKFVGGLSRVSPYPRLVFEEGNGRASLKLLILFREGSSFENFLRRAARTLR
jgi:hypothetical protein